MKMSELVLALLIWIAGETGLAIPPPPPVVLQSEEQLNEGASEPTHVRDFRALYSRETGIIYLRNDWDPADLRSRASLLHELVHHVQTFNGVPTRCPAERERQAYDLTLQWLREQGAVDPYAVLDTNEFTILIRSMCPEDYHEWP
jgi:hypothetical protein